MNRLIPALAIAILLSVFPSKGSAQVRGTAMGNLVTVVSDGPFDAGRNPALLALQPTDTAAGAYVRYRAIDDSDSEYKSSLTIDVGEPSTFNTGAVAAYSMKLTGAVLGFAVGEMGGDLVSLRESRVTYYSAYTEKEKEKTFETNPSLVTALAFPVDDTSALGMQLIVTGGYKRTDKTKDYYMGIPRIATFEIRKIEESLTASAGFGYSLRKNDTQVGFLLRSGNVTLRRQSLDYDHKDIDSGIYPSGSDSTPYKAYYTEAPRFIAGGYHRLSSNFGFAFEASYMLSNTTYNRERDASVSVEIAPTPDFVISFARNYTITTDDSLQFKGGFEFAPREGLAFTFGTGYEYRESFQESETMNRVSIRSKMEILYATLGAHYALSQTTDFSILLSGGRVKMDAKLDQESVFSARIDNTVYILDAGVAVITRY